MNRTESDNNPTVAHEHTDADSHAITRFGIGLAFLVVVSQLLLWWVFDHFSEREAKLSPHVPAIIRTQAPTLPPEPRLQGNAPLDVNPRLDLKQMRENEDAFLNHYGWIDPDRGIVHVPIDKALDIVTQTGLPKFKRVEPKQPKAPLKTGSSREHNPQFGDWLRNSGAHDDERSVPTRFGISLPVPELPSYLVRAPHAPPKPTVLAPLKTGSSREHNPQFGDWLRNSGAPDDESTRLRSGISLPVPELPSNEPDSSALASSRRAAVPWLFTAPVRPTHASSAPSILVGATHASPAATGAN